MPATDEGSPSGGPLACAFASRRWTLGYKASGPTAVYTSWINMRKRCHNPNHNKANRYIERGVTICDRWSDFNAFFEDMGHRPEGTSLDKDIRGGIGCLIYSADTCMWATPAEQNRHTSRSVKLTLNGVTQNLQDWSEELGIPVPTIRHRLKIGWTVSKALSTPELHHIRMTAENTFQVVIRRQNKRVFTTLTTYAKTHDCRSETLPSKMKT